MGSVVDFSKQELETMLKDTEEHLAETMRLGPGYYGIRERYDYAVEADERYIEKLRKQIAEYDQDKLNENQRIVLEWLKGELNDSYFKAAVSNLFFFVRYDDVEGFPNERSHKMVQAFEELNDKDFGQVLAAFAEWGMKEVAE